VSTTSEKLRELKYSHMRLGQAVGYKFPLLSQPNVEVTMVPLTEAENYQCLEAITIMEAPENIVGAMLRDRRNANEIIYRALRNPEDLDEPAFESMDEMMELLSHADITHLFDCYLEMSEDVSPSLGNFTDEEIDEVKKVLAEVEWSDLSGRQWFALRRFLLTLGLELLPANSVGSISTNLSTLMSESEKSTFIASPSGSPTNARSVESP
jgi:hypothetical protein